MKHRRTARFKKAFSRLPKEVKEKARVKFKLFSADPGHPSLQIELIEGTDGIWSGRIDYHYRWTFHYEVDEATGERVCVHRTIGKHDVYEEP